MARKLDYINVIDLECTCWDGKVPAGEKQEIIEIGIAVVRTDDGALVDSESILVRPVLSTVSPFCTQLTTLTQEVVDEGVLFADALQKLRMDYDCKNRTWASWGDFDRRMFQKQCGYRYFMQDGPVPGAKYPFGATHINVKNLFALVHGLKREMGMDAALKHVHLPLEGTHHRGVDDAQNIARLLKGLLV